MKNKWLVAGALLLSVLAFTACGKKKEESFEEVDPQAVVEDAQKEVEEADAKTEEFLEDFATMDVEKAETGTYHILIHWASGAKEASTWEISGTYDETSGMLSYENGSYTVHTWDENDKETVSEGEVTKGSLMKEGDKLRWTDSKNEDDCIFVKVSE